MRRKLLFASAIGVLILAAFVTLSSKVQVSAAPASPPASNSCDRACLNGIVDQYLAATSQRRAAWACSHWSGRMGSRRYCTCA